MSTEMREGRPVRTYRGRSLEELIPKIRAELGPDAIILREREGLTGGFNGFFQQRCVEVDAQAAGPAAVDFYDDDDAAHPDDLGPTTEFAAASEAEPYADPYAPHEPYESFSEPTAAPSPPPARGGWPHERVSPTPAPPAPPVSEPEPGPSPYAGAARSYTDTSYPEPAPEPIAEEPPAYEPEPVAHQPEPVAHQPEPVAGPAPSEELTFAQRLAQAREEREAAHYQPEPEPQPEREPEPAPEPPAPAPAPAAVREPEEPPARLRVVDAPPQPSGATVTPIPSAPAREPAATGPRRASVSVRPFPSGSTGGAGGELDNVTAGAIARDLTAQGISEAWAHELIVTAAAHLTPFTPGGDLRAGVRAVIAGGIMAPPPLPSSGAAVAFVGPGGSGKSRCSAAVAAAYRRSSTLSTRVISVGAGPRAADVAGLLAERDISVDLVRGAAAADAVTRGRERGLVVVDTDTTSPLDRQGVAALGDTLAPLGLDAIYLTLPATMSAPAARGLLDGLEALAPTALVITHADEAHELGIVTELAYLSGLPIAFIHGGLDLDTALIATDPAGIAARVLP